MRSFMRSLALLLAFALLISIVGCKAATPLPETEDMPITMDVADTTPAPAFGEISPETTATPDPNVGKTFEQLDLAIFRWHVSDDGYTFHQMVSNPESFGLDRSNVTMTLGEFTMEATRDYGKAAAGYLERLLQIPRSMLSAKQQLSYDVLEQYLERASDETDYDYFYEPLSQLSGLHINIPLMFTQFIIQSEQDAEDYLTLLADVPRYLGQVLAYEQERAQRGMFMSKDALKKILADCESIIQSKDNSYLYVTFSAAIDELHDLTPERAASLKERNESLVRNDLINAYRTLYRGLEDLENKCSDGNASLYALGAQGLSYYEATFQDESDSTLSAEDALEMLLDEMYYVLIQCAEIMENNPNVLSNQKALTTGSTDSDLALLKTLTSSVLPALPEHQLTVSDVPEELEDAMSPAAYVIPSLDAWTDNRVLINPSSDQGRILLTLAHEAYPGHLYQYVYQRSMQDLGLMQRALHFGGYAEGWSQMGEYLFVQNQTAFDSDYCKLVFYNDILSNALLPCITSIWVNYQGYGKDAIQAKLDALLLSDTQTLTEVYYQYAVEEPFYFIKYAVGYCQLMQLMRDAENNLGDAFRQKEFLSAYLDLGPGYFNLLQERMDVWTDERILEALSAT